MSKLKNSQLISNTNKNVLLNLNWFYFIVFLMLLNSCGSDTNKNQENPEKSKVEAESTVSATVSPKTILFFGNSLTAGYGLSDVNDAFPGIIQSKLDSLSLNYTVINSGVSGETTAGGLSRINWVLNQKIDVFVLELGANDGLRGISLSETRFNLQKIIEIVLKKNNATQIVLAGMQLPPNMGQEYNSEFKAIYTELAKSNQIHLIPFLLKNVGGIPGLNQEDGIHPTAEGQRILAENVWEVLKPIIIN